MADLVIYLNLFALHDCPTEPMVIYVHDGIANIYADYEKTILLDTVWLG